MTTAMSMFALVYNCAHATFFGVGRGHSTTITC